MNRRHRQNVKKSTVGLHDVRHTVVEVRVLLMPLAVFDDGLDGSDADHEDERNQRPIRLEGGHDTPPNQTCLPRSHTFLSAKQTATIAN